MNQETIIIVVLAAISSGFASAIFVKILDIIQEIFNQSRIEKLRIKHKKEEIHDAYLQEKNAVYIEALKKLSGIRAGFDMTYDFPYNNEHINRLIDEINKNATELSAKMRLYASDDVFNIYNQLSLWSKYAFTRSSGQWRLMEDGKWLYSLYTTVLARSMQEDLGFREYVGNPETVFCPNCGRTHDAYKKCDCGMTMNQTMEKLGEGLRIAWEKGQKSAEDQALNFTENGEELK